MSECCNEVPRQGKILQAAAKTSCRQINKYLKKKKKKSLQERLMERKRLEIRVRHFRDQQKGMKGKVKMTSR